LAVPEHQQRGQQGAEFAHDGGDHHGAEILVRTEAGEHGNSLPDDHEAQRQGQEAGQGHQAHAGTGHLQQREGAEDWPGHARLADHHTQRDERERAQAVNGEEESHQRSPEKTKEEPG
jgi:hypothetical protein